MKLLRKIDNLVGKVADIIDDNKYEALIEYDVAELDLVTWRPSPNMRVFCPLQLNTHSPYFVMAYYDNLKMIFAVHSFYHTKTVRTGIEAALGKVYSEHLKQAFDRLTDFVIKRDAENFPDENSKQLLYKQMNLFTEQLGIKYHDDCD